MLSWDLHLHPGPSPRVERWGSGWRVREAAREAGVEGFVWKSHSQHTVTFCRQLPDAPPWALPSASLNQWASPESVIDALAEGALWLWGPTINESGSIVWDTALPEWWAEIAADSRLRPLVAATGHLGREGRRQLAEWAAQSGHRCSVTHSLHLEAGEAEELAELGCSFEIDAYTWVNPVPGRARLKLERLLEIAGSHQRVVYATSDGGQPSTGNPFTFAARVLGELENQIGVDAVRRISVLGPQAMVEGVFEHGWRRQCG